MALPTDVLVETLERLSLAVLVFSSGRPVYANRAAELLRARLRTSYRIELDVVLGDQLRALQEQRSSSTAGGSLLTLVTAPNGEPFYLEAIPLEDENRVAVTVRTVGGQIEAIRRRYGLSKRESHVAELVLHGYKNRDIAAALNVAPATIKKHLTKIFDKVGVHSRSQLQTRLA